MISYNKSIKMYYHIVFLFVGLLFISANPKEEICSLSQNEQQRIIGAHNKWRAKVKVDSIAWSDELAIEAQKWANYLAKKACRMKHSKTQNGENIYWSNYDSTPEEVVGDWASEKKYYRGGKIKASKTSIYGHYTQVVWYNTKLVGCGRAKCKNGDEIWVCTYSPAGNYIGEKAY